ncbi:hypothetical protein [Agromyces sp. Marseille-P2726]|uniref:hypothetical protein n=1 Tax=Agromyces sp. Marseille-P2726 TaxID=2709132 RepID=UPI00156E78F7|nr:hypothetical protein [Agromyces sp. Marseille-P2726]
MFDRLPRSVQARLLPRAFGFERRDVPPPIAAPTGSRRLYIAPVNFAGAATGWARAAERIPGVAARNMVYREAGGFAFPADYEVPVAVYDASPTWQRAQFRAVSSGFTHVMIEAERPLFGTRFARDATDVWATVRAEVQALRASGVQTAMACHGSDIRLPSRHAAREADSPFAAGVGGSPAYRDTALLDEHARANRALLTEVGGKVFVSTPDLLIDVPEGIWLPAVIGAPWFDSGREAPLERDVPVVVHVPSRSGLKGSELIEETMRRLHDEGVVRYERREGVAAADMPAIYGAADIVLDQFSLGIYGVAACEALAAGRIVVSHVSDQVRTHVRSATGRDLPVVETRAADLEATLRRILADRARYRDVAAEGPAFVREVHDGRMTSEVLEREFLGS